MKLERLFYKNMEDSAGQTLYGRLGLYNRSLDMINAVCVALS